MHTTDLHRYTKQASLLSTVMTHAPLIRATGQTLKMHGPYMGARMSNMAKPIVQRMPNKMRQMSESLARKTQEVGSKTVDKLHRLNNRVQSTLNERIPKPITSIKNNYSNMSSFALDNWGMSI